MIKTIEEIDGFRKRGFRPNIVGCFLNGERLLLVYKKDHGLWQLPQGGVNNKESLEKALVREMSEELGTDFVKARGEYINLVAEAKVEFPEGKQGSRSLETDNGEPVTMKGKKYFFLAIISTNSDLNIKDTEFDDYKWASYEEGLKLAEKIYQKGKRRITIKILEKLKELELVS